MEKTTFQKELEQLINRHSKENASDTPDFILAAFIEQSLEAFNSAIRHRDQWYKKDDESEEEPEMAFI